MPVTDITVSQDNIVAGVNIMAVHSPLVFLIDVTYTGTVPVLKCDITIDGITPVNEDATFKCIFLADLTPTVRRFMFRADSLLRGYMEDFDDFVQTAESVAVVLKTQQAFILVFYDEEETEEATVDLVAFAATRQFSETPAISPIYNNEDTLYIAGADMPIYVYFYNKTAGVAATISDGTTTYNMGTAAEVNLLVDAITIWQGIGYETSPDNWDIYSSRARSVTWWMSQDPVGEALLTMDGALAPDYFAIRNDEITWEKGVEVWLRIRYKGGGANVAISALEKPSYANTPAGLHAIPLPYSADYVDLEIKFISLTTDWLIDGPRCPRIQIGSTGLEAVDVEVSIDTITIFTPPSSQGYYRLKVHDLEVETAYEMESDSVSVAIKTVRVKPFCTGMRYVKYLDHNGQYRFYPFNANWQTKDAPKMIGKVNQLITNILDNQSDSKNIGYTNERKITLVADDVIADELVLLSDIYTSPRVYLYVGAGTTDTAADWLRVTVASGENLVRRKKGNTSKVELTVTLPEWYNITML